MVRMTTFVITKGTTILYRTQSWPRFVVAWHEVKHLPDADWTTSYERTTQCP
jgi:hypothetical protein